MGGHGACMHGVQCVQAGMQSSHGEDVETNMGHSKYKHVVPLKMKQMQGFGAAW
jgi:hypothetical protein